MPSISPPIIAPSATCCTTFKLSQSLSYILRVFLLLLFCFVSPGASVVSNLSIPLTSPSLVYTPFVCNATEVSLNPDVCQGGWQMSADNIEVSTTGSSKPILPQIFLRFRASSIWITTSRTSNATVEIIVAWESIMRRSNFDSSMGSIGIMDLPDNSTSLLTITVNPSTASTLFGLTSVELTTPLSPFISSVLPPPTITLSSEISPTVFIPPSSNPNTFTTTTTTTTGPSQSAQKLSPRTVKLAIALSVGLGVGLTLLAVLLFWLFRRHRKSQRRDGRWSFVT